jgi:hypothetical protein
LLLRIYTGKTHLEDPPILPPPLCKEETWEVLCPVVDSAISEMIDAYRTLGSAVDIKVAR